mmetsp:Transcript_7222/g.20028  ORF Transcript_7222/g.20028 Transcript_7222/m.20028 type:complete len:342 (-) Transcript_7222:100-1125(-)
MAGALSVTPSGSAGGKEVRGAAEANTKGETKSAPTSMRAGATLLEGQVLPGSAEELRELANEALKCSEVTKATHLYTMAIDLLSKGIPRDQNGIAADADLLALNKSSSGQLAKLLSNRSLAHLKQGDAEAAAEDADACTRADPTFEKGHLRLLAALEALGAALPQQLEACDRALGACPESELLVTRKWRLKKAIAEQPRPDEASTAEAIAEAQRLADDPSDPRRAAAAADLGSVLAAGAHGQQKDTRRAEHYLRIGAEGGEVAAQRNLGLLLLELGRPAEAAQELSRAASAGDEQAADALHQLLAETRQKEAEARAKLEELAETGDVRALEMLGEFRVACA